MKRTKQTAFCLKNDYLIKGINQLNVGTNKTISFFETWRCLSQNGIPVKYIFMNSVMYFIDQKICLGEIEKSFSFLNTEKTFESKVDHCERKIALQDEIKRKIGARDLEYMPFSIRIEATKGKHLGFVCEEEILYK